MNRAAIISACSYVLLACASHEHEEGISVGVFAEPINPIAQTWKSDAGETIVLTKGFIALSDLEIVKCAETISTWRWPSLIREAHAHTTSSPTKIGVPLVQDILGGSQVSMGTLTPPPARYCEVKGHFAPADADAKNLPREADMIGKTFKLELKLGTDASTRTVTLAGSQHIAFQSFVNITMSEATPHASVLLSMQSTEWFRGIDFSSSDEKARSDRFAANLGVSARVAASATP